MRVNITLNKESKDGYQNTDDPLLQEFYDSECNEILAEHVIEFVPFFQQEQVVRIWMKKLRKYGKLIIISNDLDDACRKYINGEITASDLNNILYGDGSAGIYKTGHINMQGLSEFLQENKLKILRKKIEGTKFMIIAQRV